MQTPSTTTTDHDEQLKRAKQARKLATTTWRDQIWINQYCGGLLVKDAALPYFCNVANPFYDRTCNNELLKMQGSHPAAPQLDDMLGVRYALHYSYEPNLYVIKKERVVNVTPKLVHVLNCYYILGGMVYPAPVFHQVVSSRMYNTMFSMNKLFHQLQPAAQYSTTSGQYFWQWEKDSEEGLQGSSISDETKSEIEENERILMSTKPPYSKEIQDHVRKLVLDMQYETQEQIQKRMDAQQPKPAIVTE